MKHHLSLIAAMVLTLVPGRLQASDNRFGFFDKSASPDLVKSFAEGDESAYPEVTLRYKGTGQCDWNNGIVTIEGGNDKDSLVVTGKDGGECVVKSIVVAHGLKKLRVYGNLESLHVNGDLGTLTVSGGDFGTEGEGYTAVFGGSKVKIQVKAVKDKLTQTFVGGNVRGNLLCGTLDEDGDIVSRGFVKKLMTLGGNLEYGSLITSGFGSVRAKAKAGVGGNVIDFEIITNSIEVVEVVTNRYEAVIKDRKVEINYFLTNTTAKSAPVFQVKFYGQIGDGEQFELTNISGDGATGIVFGDGAKQAVAQVDVSLGSGPITVTVLSRNVTDQAVYLKLDLETYKMTYGNQGPSTKKGAKSKYKELWLRRVEPGTFVMGSAKNSPGRYSNEIEHTVTISQAYYVGVFQLTEGQYDRIVNGSTTSNAATPKNFSYNILRGTDKGATWPIDNDYRVDQDSFLGKLRAKTGNGLLFDLPTEAQWEMACRDKGTADRTPSGFWGSGKWNDGSDFNPVYDEYGRYEKDPNLDKLGWYHYNSGNKVHEVGLKKASSLGTYDMHGNVCEWCLDWYTEDISLYVSDSKGPKLGRVRVLRGGSDGNFKSFAKFCRSEYRYYDNPSYVNHRYGCRLILVPSFRNEKEVNTDTKVGIDFSLTKSTSKTAPVFSVKFYGRIGGGNRFELQTLEGDGATGIALGAGAKHAVWNLTADLGGGVKPEDVTISVVATDITSQAIYLTLDLETYKMTYGTLAPDVYVGAKSKYKEIWFRRVEPGTFVMGSGDEPGWGFNETQHTVTISQAYYVGVFELTGGQYDRIVESFNTSTTTTPKHHLTYNILRGTDKGATWPEETDHRVDKNSFLGFMRAKTGNGLLFDLPTEAQWEMACRDKGTPDRTPSGFWGSSKWNDGSDFIPYYVYGNWYVADNSLDKLGWYNYQHKGINEVGLKKASSLGTYDMHGNVCEWCLDWYTADITSYVSDPKGPVYGEQRVRRGGRCIDDPPYCRAGSRESDYPLRGGDDYYGCRIILVQ